STISPRNHRHADIEPRLRLADRSLRPIPADHRGCGDLVGAERGVRVGLDQVGRPLVLLVLLLAATGTAGATHARATSTGARVRPAGRPGALAKLARAAGAKTATSRPTAARAPRPATGLLRTAEPASTGTPTAERAEAA